MRLVAATALPGLVYLSTNSGLTWTNCEVPTSRWTCLASSGDGRVLVAGTRTQSMYVSTNGGVSLFPSDAPDGGWQSIASSGDGSRLLAAVDPGFVYTSTNSGVHWSLTDAPLYNGVDTYYLHVASSSDGHTLAVAGGANGPNYGFIYTSTNGGWSWSQTAAPSVDWRAISCSADGNRLFAWQNLGPAWASTNGGISWYSLDSPIQPWSAGVTSADGGFAAGCASIGGIFTSRSVVNPRVRIDLSISRLLLSWTQPSTPFVLQGCSSGNPTSWIGLTNEPVLNPANMNFEVVLPLGNSNAFFRLARP